MREMMFYESPVGIILCIFQENSLVRLEFNPKGNVLDNCKVIKQHCFQRQLESYFSGSLMVFSQQIRFIEGTKFQQLVWEKTMKIPFGTTITYKDIALSIGLSGGFQAIGQALKKNPIPLIVPCHRVIGVDGSLKGFASGVEIKAWLIKHEQNTLNLS